MHTNTDNTDSNRFMEQSLRGDRATGYLAASPGGALPRTKIEGVSTTADPRVGNNSKNVPGLPVLLLSAQPSLCLSVSVSIGLSLQCIFLSVSLSVCLSLSLSLSVCLS